MANNRMYLRHKATDRMILLAKFYPSMRWQLFRVNAINQFLIETTEAAVHQHGADDLFGNTDYELMFEHDDTPAR